MHKISYSNQAITDLEEAISYISLESKSNAKAYLDRYNQKIELLRTNPKIGTYCKNKNINMECRILLFESHIIIYKILEEKKEIFIIRIFHTSRNYQKDMK